MDLTGNTFFEGPAGKIEAILKEPSGEVTRAAIVCHPHPLFGGTMHNKVVYRIAKAFQKAGFAVLRFNFRGAGQSQGEHDRGRGEQDDLRAAIKFVEERYPEAEIWLAGFSFGSAVMLRAACEDERIRALIGVGVPVSKYDFDRVQTCAQPKLFVQGELDEFGTPADLERFVAALGEPKRLKIIEGTGHFFEDKLDELERAVAEFVEATSAQEDPRA
ncbi:MAG TPA: alpha/beta fold hydrolase [Blastocatellia bacterium]|nr:alpha/beta fold hydrolase [Blastocatellia bacterium]